VASTVSSAETTSSGCHHLSTDDSDHLRASATLTNGGRPSLHRQIPTQVLAGGPTSASARRRRAGVRTRQSKNTNAALAAYDVLHDPPV
jgi:S-formylglutathione hydrolase FrmB